MRRTEALLQTLANQTTMVLHNAKFDIAFFEYHFNLVFPKFEDTMLLHYLIDENPGTHGLKQLAMKYTVYGDYEKPQYDWMAKYRKDHGMLKNDFTWDLIPFDIMKTYAAMDAVVTLLVYKKFVKIKQNKRLGKVYDNILIPGCRFLTDIQENGVPFDIQRLTQSQSLMQVEIDEAIAELYKNPAIASFEKINGNLLILTALFSFAVYYSTSLVLILLERRLALVQIAQTRKFLGSWQRNPKSLHSSSQYVRNPRLKILIWTKSYHSWIEIVDYAQVLTFIAQLVGGSALLGSLICNSSLVTIL